MLLWKYFTAKCDIVFALTLEKASSENETA